MIKVGVTGGIAAGKTVMSDELRRCGAEVVDADVISRQIVAKNSVGAMLIKETFGEKFFDSEGELNRRQLSEHVFGSPFQLGVLNALLHPLIKKEIHNKLQRLESKGAKAAFVVVPLLIESGMAPLFDQIWVIKSSEENRIKRLIGRDNITKEQARRIILRQASEDTRLKFADKVFDNDGERDDFVSSVVVAYRELLGDK